MHELSVVTALVEQIQEVLARENGCQLVSLTVAMGALSGVDRDAFEFCFPLVVEGTPLHGAQLHIEEVPLRLSCRECGAESQPDEVFLIQCMTCGSGLVEIVDGRDLVLRSLEVR
ncbi:MAG: hydrogenase maturation nickel metallochaperone HypA [Magnetococcales bacterium]|nr:hydrogenase maturation nickel metallochaperone HypA [Magnetococcales bacterium]